MKRAFSFVVCDRPDYFKRVLEYASKLEGLSEWSVFFNCEPHCAESIRLAREWCEKHNGEVFVNDPRAGHTKNFHNAFRRSFHAGYDYVAICEDDVLVAVDMLRWHTFASEKFKDDPTVFCVAGSYYGQKGQFNPGKLHSYGFCYGFMNTCWGTWKDRWFEPEGMETNWENYETIEDGKVTWNYRYKGYDYMVQNVHFKGRREPFLIIPRGFNIGERGVNVNQSIYDTLIKLDDWAGNYDLSGNREYVEDSVYTPRPVGTCPQ